MYGRKSAWILIVILLLIGESSIQMTFVNATTTIKPSLLLTNQKITTSKKKVTIPLNLIGTPAVTPVDQNTLKRTASSFFSETKSTLAIAAQQGILNRNRPIIKSRRIVQKNPVQRKQKQRPKNRVTKESFRTFSTTANTFQYRRATPSRWETTPTVRFVKTWTKTKSIKSVRPELTTQKNANIFQNSNNINNPVFTQSRPINPIGHNNNRQTNPGDALYYDQSGTFNGQSAILRPINNNVGRPISNIPPRNINRNPPAYEYGDETMPSANGNRNNNNNNRKPNSYGPMKPTLRPNYNYNDYNRPLNNNNNRNPASPGQKFKTSTKRPLYYDDEYYDDDYIPPKNKIPTSTRPAINNPSNKDEEYEDENSNIDQSKKTTKSTDEEEEEDEDEELPTTKKLVKPTKTAPKVEDDEEEEEEEEEEPIIKKPAETTKSTTVAYVPDVPKVTSNIVTFPKDFDKNGPDPDYKDKTIDLDAEISTTPYKPTIGNIFGKNFGISR